MNQPRLPLTEWSARTPHEVERTLAEQFEEFHRENPHIYRLLVRFARQVRVAGWEQYSIASIFERVRWHVQVETKGEPFKLNNNLRAFYARRIMEREPDLEGFFETRRQTAA